MQWGPIEDAKLFMYMIDVHKVDINYKALADAFGNDVTKKAITHRLAKLRLMADEHIPYEGSASPSLPLPPHIKRGKPTNDAALAIIAGNYAHIYPSVATFDLVAAQTSAPALAIARSIHTPKVKKVITPKAKGKGSPLKNVVYSASDSESDTPMSDFEALSITKKPAARKPAADKMVDGDEAQA